MQDNGTWRRMVSMVVLARTQATQREVVEGQQYNRRSSSTKNHTFFSPIASTHAKSQSRVTQVGPWPGHCKEVTINLVIAICSAHRPWSHEPRSHHLFHQQTKAIISSHHKFFHRFRHLSILHHSMLDIFRRQKLQSSSFSNWQRLIPIPFVH